jgi:hypothetical protein
MEGRPLRGSSSIDVLPILKILYNSKQGQGELARNIGASMLPKGDMGGPSCVPGHSVAEE